MRRAGIALLTFVSVIWCEVPECNLAPGLQQSGPRRSFEGESLYEYMDGNSEGYLLYGFRKMTGVSCKRDASTFIVDLSDMGDPELAYGMFSANRDVRLDTEKIGTAAQVLKQKVIVAKGPYYLEIAAEPEGDYRDLLRSMATKFAAQVQGTTGLPAALSWFPASGLQPGSPRLVPQSVLGIRILKRGYVAQYADGLKAFVVPDIDAEAAAATLDKLKARLAEPRGIGSGDSGWQGRDKYLGTMAVFRKGRYVAGYAGLPDSADAAKLTAALAELIR